MYKTRSLILFYNVAQWTPKHRCTNILCYVYVCICTRNRMYQRTFFCRFPFAQTHTHAVHKWTKEEKKTTSTERPHTLTLTHTYTAKTKPATFSSLTSFSQLSVGISPNGTVKATTSGKSGAFFLLLLLSLALYTKLKLLSICVSVCRCVRWLCVAKTPTIKLKHGRKITNTSLLLMRTV